MRRVLVLFATSLLLWALVAQLNHALTDLRVYFFPAALYLAYGALVFPLREGMAVTLLGGLVCDANSPVAFGTHMLLFAAIHALLFHLRDRVPRDDAIGRVTIVLLVNLVLFLTFSFLEIGRSPVAAVAWPRLIADLLFTQVLLAFVTPWFFALQARALVLARAEREAID